MRKLLFAILPFYVSAASAADVAYDVDIPASEEAESGEVQEPVQEYIPPPPTPETRMRKRAEEPAQDEQKLGKRLASDDTPVPTNTAILQGLNKVMGRVSTLEVPLGTMANFENLQIIARKCVKSPPDARPENSALLEIRELRTGEEPKQVFLGWMMSSSPALSSLEHPVYDITVLSCEFKKDLE